MDNVKLCYFNSRGFAEVSRLLMALGGQEYEDIRWADNEDWLRHKPEAPFGHCPYLVFTDREDGKEKKIGQSAAISCFLARKLGFYPQAPWDAAVVDQVIHNYRDLGFEWIKEEFEPDEHKKAELTKKLTEQVCPEYFGHFAKLLEGGKGPFYLGESITLADLYVFDIMFAMKKMKKYDAGTDFPILLKLYHEVLKNPRIKAHVETRNDTPL